MNGARKITIARSGDYEIEVERQDSDLRIKQGEESILLPIADALRLIGAIASVSEYEE
jgi:hypothetical protein